MNIDEQLRDYNDRIQRAITNSVYARHDREYEEAIQAASERLWEQDAFLDECIGEAPDYLREALKTAYRDGDELLMGKLVKRAFDKHTRRCAEYRVERGL